MPVGISFMDVMALGVKHPLPTDIRELSKGKLLKKRLKAVNATRCCACGEGTTGGNRRAKAIPFVIRTYKTNGGDFFLMTWSGDPNPPEMLNNGRALDNANGTYTVRYKPKDVGAFKLSVTTSGVDIRGSPFNIVISNEGGGAQFSVPMLELKKKRIGGGGAESTRIPEKMTSRSQDPDTDSDDDAAFWVAKAQPAPAPQAMPFMFGGMGGMGAAKKPTGPFGNAAPKAAPAAPAAGTFQAWAMNTTTGPDLSNLKIASSPGEDSDSDDSDSSDDDATSPAIKLKIDDKGEGGLC